FALLNLRIDHVDRQPARGLGLLDRGAGELRGELPFLLVLLVVLAGEAGGARRQHGDRENRPHHVLRGTYLVTWHESRNARVSLWLTNASPPTAATWYTRPSRRTTRYRIRCFPFSTVNSRPG